MVKKKKKNKVPSKVWAKYKIEGSSLKRERCCPKCGQGYFLANMKDRYYCGKCRYLEMKPVEKK
ncbi:30S ribosomal protein S27ae [Candidatus Woesearchaeota archaeon]|nr:30S ribosomal protein S27ae [Candidatus Woesearchaeota archaeon]